MNEKIYGMFIIGHKQEIINYKSYIRGNTKSKSSVNIK